MLLKQPQSVWCIGYFQYNQTTQTIPNKYIIPIFVSSANWAICPYPKILEDRQPDSRHALIPGFDNNMINFECKDIASQQRMHICWINKNRAYDTMVINTIQSNSFKEPRTIRKPNIITINMNNVLTLSHPIMLNSSPWINMNRMNWSIFIVPVLIKDNCTIRWTWL